MCVSNPEIIIIIFTILNTGLLFSILWVDLRILGDLIRRVDELKARYLQLSRIIREEDTANSD
jgi:hypothetical protein